MKPSRVAVLDMSRHIPLYVHVLRCARALHALRSRRLAPALRPLPRLLALMSRTTNSYATKLRYTPLRTTINLTHTLALARSATQRSSAGSSDTKKPL